MASMRNALSMIPGLGRRLAGHRSEKGQAAFEFLLIIPFFIYFMLLLIDFGIVMYGYVSVANAAREGARFAAVNCNDGSCAVADVVTRTRDRSSGFLPTSGPVTTVTASWNGLTIGAETWAPSERGSNVVVTATRPHTLLFFPWATIPVTSCAEMRLEDDDQGAGLSSGSGC